MPSTFSARLRAELDKPVRTNRSVAAAIRVRESTISDWLAGRKMASLQNFIDLADHLRVSLDYLAGRVDEPGGRFGEGEAATTLARIEAVMDDVRGRVVVPEDDSAREADDFGPATDARKRRDECA